MSLAQSEFFTHVKALSMSFFPVYLQFSLLFVALAAYLFFLMFTEVFLQFQGVCINS